MQCLQPVDPDEQKERIMRKYEHEFQAASAKFTAAVQQKTVNLLKNVNLTILQYVFLLTLFSACFYAAVYLLIYNNTKKKSE